MSNLHIVVVAKERVLVLLFLLLIEESVSHQRVEERFTLGVGRKELFALIAEAVEHPAIRQAVEHPSADTLQIYALHEVVDVLVRSVLLAFADDSLRRSLANALNTRQSETNFAMRVHRELQAALVHVRS